MQTTFNIRYGTNDNLYKAGLLLEFSDPKGSPAYMKQGGILILSIPVSRRRLRRLILT